MTRPEWVQIDSFGAAAIAAVLDSRGLISTAFQGTGDYWEIHAVAKDLLLTLGAVEDEREAFSAHHLVSWTFYWARECRVS